MRHQGNDNLVFFLRSRYSQNTSEYGAVPRETNEAARPVTDYRHVQQLARIQHRPGKEPSEAKESDSQLQNLKKSRNLGIWKP